MGKRISWVEVFVMGMIAIGIQMVNYAIENLIIAAVAQWLWSIFCSYFHLPEIGYWQMWSVLTFLAIVVNIFKGKPVIEND